MNRTVHLHHRNIMISRGKGNLNIRGKNWKNVNIVLQENLRNVVHIKLWDFKQCFENFKRLAT